MKATTGFSMSLGSGSKSRPIAAPGSTKLGGKSKLAHDESDDEACDDGRVELVQAFDQSNGAIGVGDSERGGGGGGDGPLVIPALKNRDWREESLKRKRAVWVPPEARAGADAGDSSETVGGNTGQAGQAGYGLQVMVREEKMEEEKGVVVRDGEGGDVTMADGGENGEPKTEDQLALEALISGDSKKKSTLVLALQSNTLDWREARAKNATQSETDAYRADLALRPDVPDLAAYDAVPVEEFGAALLRGMGWKEGMELGRGKKADEIGAKPKAVGRRPALLGLGAKTQAEAMGVELGGWGKGDKAALGAKGGKGWVDKTYVPVVLRNKVTGQIMDSLPPTGVKGSTNNEERTRRREMEIRGEIRKERGDGEDTDGSEKRRRRKDYGDREGGRDRRREYDIPNGTQTDRRSSRREKDREYDQVRRDRCREKERERGMDMGRDCDRGDRDRRDRDRTKERDRDRERRRDEGKDKDRAPDHSKERERDRRRDRVDEYDRRRRSSRSRERW